MCPSVHPSACLSFRPYYYLFVCLPVCQSVRQSVHLSVHNQFFRLTRSNWWSWVFDCFSHMLAISAPTEALWKSWWAHPMAKRILSILVWIWIHRRSILGDLGEKICSCIIIVLLFDFFASKRCYLSFLWGFNPLLRPKAPLGPPYGLILLDICIYLAANEVQILFVTLFFWAATP